MASGEFRLRPLNLTEVLDEGFSIYRRNFGLLFGIALIPYLFLGMATWAMTLYMDRAGPVAFDQILIATFVMIGVMMIASIAGEVASAAMASAISERVLGREATIGQSYGRVVRRLFPFILYLIIRTLALMAGFMLCCIGVFVVYSYILIAVCPFIIEGRRPVDSFNRSIELTKGRALNAFLLIILIMVLGGVLPLAIGGGFALAAELIPGVADVNSPGFATWSLAENLLSGLAQAFVAPALIAFITLFYYDLRVRKEAFDLHVLAENLAAGR